MERDTIFVVSDVHLGSKHFSNENQKTKFWDFLEDVGNNPKAKELILNGDIIETWSSPIEEVYTLQQIFAHEDVVTFSHFIRFVIEKGVEVVYIIGNHDSRVTEASLHSLLGTEVKVLYEYVKYGVHFSHGHKFDYFNSTDPVGPEGLPIGYYATRVDHNHDIGFSHEKRDSLRDTMHKVLPDLTKTRVVVAEKAIITAFMTHMFFKSRPFLSLVSSGSLPRVINEKGEGETMSMISNRLYPLYHTWAQSNTNDYVAATMRCSMTAEYSWFFENGIYGKVTHVVHGHTHKGLVKEFPNTPFGPVTYVNDGAWELDRMNYAKFVLNASSEGVIDWVEHEC